MHVHARGIVSYAGLDKAALWKQAKQVFAQTDDPIPPRFAAFLPLFPVELIQSMRYVGASEPGRTMVSKNGFSIDPGEYHRLLYEQLPELYVGDNFARNFDNESRFVGRSVFTVDQAWAAAFPQYQPFLGERLAIYPIAGGPQAVAVPESIFPKGCGVLHSAEIEMRIVSRCEHYTAYVKERIAQGDLYDAVRFENEYLARYDLAPVTIRQSEVGRMMQDLSIIKSLQGEPAAPGLYTENAKRAEHILQYTPCHTACDTFESLSTSRGTARLMQLYFDHDDFISDLWLPYADAIEYLDKQAMTLDVKALCEGFQLPPAYDPETLGGRYPDCIRIAVVRDRKLRPLVAEALNNPAYGSGMNPLGMLNKLIFLEDSKELLRLNKLSREQADIRCCNLEVSPEDYNRMLERATAQEQKGSLIDAMYRRESALKQIPTGSRAYGRAKELLNRRVETAEGMVQAENSQLTYAQLSGYDADIDYLRRMAKCREAAGEQTAAFAADALRDMSVESGYAMRGSPGRFRYEELALPEEPEEEEEEQPTDGAESGRDAPDCSEDGGEAVKDDDAPASAVENNADDRRGNSSSAPDLGEDADDAARNDGSPIAPVAAAEDNADDCVGNGSGATDYGEDADDTASDDAAPSPARAEAAILGDELPNEESDFAPDGEPIEAAVRDEETTEETDPFGSSSPDDPLINPGEAANNAVTFFPAIEGEPSAGPAEEPPLSEPPVAAAPTATPMAQLLGRTAPAASGGKAGKAGKMAQLLSQLQHKSDPETH